MDIVIVDKMYLARTTGDSESPGDGDIALEALRRICHSLFWMGKLVYPPAENRRWPRSLVPVINRSRLVSLQKVVTDRSILENIQQTPAFDPPPGDEYLFHYCRAAGVRFVVTEDKDVLDTARAQHAQLGGVQFMTLPEYIVHHRGSLGGASIGTTTLLSWAMQRKQDPSS